MLATAFSEPDKSTPKGAVVWRWFERHLSRSDDQAFHWRRCFGARKDIATQKSRGAA